MVLDIESSVFPARWMENSTEYEGETARNAYTRWVEHMITLRMEDDENPLWKPCFVAHMGIKAEFKMLIVRQL